MTPATTIIKLKLVNNACIRKRVSRGVRARHRNPMDK